MSSSPPNVRPTKGKIFKLNTPRILSCPQCGQLALKQVRGACTLQDGTVLPNLERWQCRHCHANFFDDAAMRAIAEFRQRSTRKATATGKR